MKCKLHCLDLWCDRTIDQGKRDYARLRLLWGNALRRNEVSLLNINDFDPDARTLRILGKGRGTQSEVIDLGDGTVEAIASFQPGDWRPLKLGRDASTS